MFTITKRLEIAGSHCLRLDYESKCKNVHGHNWIVTVHCRADELNQNGMVVDFTEIKKKIHSALDHKHINDVVPGMNPTAENLARWITEQIPSCFRADVQESEGNTASYEV
jgi:6-pyruvoyltetrahydropterin/6-carboxytetrahydropterin synthase